MGRRFDRRQRGRRFTENRQVRRMDSQLRGLEDEVGTTVVWYRFDPVNSTMDETYSEGTRVYHQPFELPVLSVIRTPGAAQMTGQGFYTVDSCELRAPYDAVRRAGLWQLDERTEAYQRDRFVYDEEVWRPVSITAEPGQIHTQRIVVLIQATEIKPEELVFEPQFARYSA